MSAIRQSLCCLCTFPVARRLGLPPHPYHHSKAFDARIQHKDGTTSAPLLRAGATGSGARRAAAWAPIDSVSDPKRPRRDAGPVCSARRFLNPTELLAGRRAGRPRAVCGWASTPIGTSSGGRCWLLPAGGPRRAPTGLVARSAPASWPRRWRRLLVALEPGLDLGARL